MKKALFLALLLLPLYAFSQTASQAQFKRAFMNANPQTPPDLSGVASFYKTGHSLMLVGALAAIVSVAVANQNPNLAKGLAIGGGVMFMGGLVVNVEGSNKLSKLAQ